MKTIRIALMLSLLMATGHVGAQRLILTKRFGNDWNTTTLTSENKPNGYMYRMRVDVRCSDLPRVPAIEDLELYIAEPIDTGWMALYRRSAGSTDYLFIVVFYDHDKQPRQVVNLGAIANNDYCEVQDIRWDNQNHRLLFNMACPSYASAIGGKGSKLYSYDPEAGRIVWETDYLVSNDIFITDSRYVFCSYGFTSEKKFLYMLDKQTGRVYSKLPMVFKVEYMELKQENGRETLYVVDYNNHLFSFAVSDTSAKPTATPAPAKGQEPEVFTVVYATSDDGFLNVRRQPTTKSPVVEKLYSIFHGMGNGVLLEKGPTWSKVSVWGKTGWVYNKYLGYQTWYKGGGKPVLVATRDDTPIFGENYADDGDLPVFVRVKKGTVIADQFEEHNGYYELQTAHDFLFIRKEDATVRK